MNISVEITKDLLGYMDRKVGREYKSRSEVVRDAIRRMIREDIRHEAKQKSIRLEELEQLREDAAQKNLKKEYL